MTLLKQISPLQTLTIINYYIAVGEVKSRGIEFDIVGEISPGWKVIAFVYVYAFSDRITTTQAPNYIIINKKSR